MASTTQGSSRRALNAAVSAQEGDITFRDRLDQDEVIQLDSGAVGAKRTGTVILDQRRNRPLYFDGRFLAARDLTREQNYFLTRQADLGRAGGVGVVTGLLVSKGGSNTSIKISAGHGVTNSGAEVLVENDRELNLAAITEIQQLDGAFGLREIPNEFPGSRTGLFIVALRAVEFTSG